MKNLSIALFAFLFVTTQTFGQSRLYSEIQQAKKTDVNFKNVSFFQVANADTTIVKEFTNPNEVFFFETLSGLPNTGTKAISVTIPLDTNSMVLELMEVPDYFYNYNVVTSSGNTFPANRDIKSYRGAVKGEANSFAAITFYEDEAMGVVVVNNDNFEIVKDKSSGKHIFYNNKNRVTQPQRINCGTVYEYNSIVSSVQQNNANKQGRGTRGTPIDKLVRFHVEVDNFTYYSFDSISSVQAFVQGLFNIVAIIFENEDIFTSISELYIWTSADPYNQTNNKLTDFQNFIGNIHGDLGVLISRQWFQSKAAGLNGLCNSNKKEKLAIVSLVNAPAYYPFPTYSDAVYLVAHEVGHLMGSPHTHDCFWIVNGVPNQALDGCVPVDNPPFGCSQPPYPPQNERTIMSYCDDYDFSTGFGEQPGDLIRDNVRNAPCLQCATEYIIDFKDETIATDTTITGCEINVQNVNVTNNSKLILNAAQKTTIIKDFSVPLGSKLEIK
jgi:hypothetical protein